MLFQLICLEFMICSAVAKIAFLHYLLFVTYSGTKVAYLRMLLFLFFLFLFFLIFSF
jgi:hypothetical protein